MSQFELPQGVDGVLSTPARVTTHHQTVADSYEAGPRKPWEEMRKHLANVLVKEHYFGLVYIASGTKE